MHWITRTAVQASCILVVSALLALGVNAIRPDGLPVLHAGQESAVTFDEASGEIALKDAALLFMTNRAVFLDARSQFEYEAGHIQNSLSVPVEDFAYLFEEIEPQLQGKEAIITYCDGERCPLSHELADLLEEKGFDNVYVLKNGWTLWKNEGLPIETGA
ncbi:rhodanese [Oceanidesulfovibrio indonesiensis]|uniref:Rhodanese n=1 Tax=Oceanidesulfovibrio indonesiensis TaxID=54767 RepID=A0A7M3MI10_9BACT|nr:rhodanese-like domain-containing protein [Oceanidesulfovibrio indonesiensis]TVM19259.1 rhodanese [Oceanidesulfovibrio indonesiensis]